MKFGPVPLHHALGGILAHSANLRGGWLRKGKVLDATDLKRMADEGWQDVIVAQLSADDLDENEAAATLAASLCNHPFGMVRTSETATTGRMNLYSEVTGIVRFKPAMINAINEINPMITVATVPPYQRVAKGDMIATIKIIAYGVPKADIDAAVALAKGNLIVDSLWFRKVTLIETQIGEKALPIKGRNAVQTRVARLGAELTERCIVPHTVDAIADAIAQAPGDAIFLLTASATSDPNDVGPAALLQAGGDMTRFGMPVDPGNLLFFGFVGRADDNLIGAKPVIGLPGCARSLALNGADWVIERMLCRVRITQTDIAHMGVGGLLKEIPTRPQPRDRNTPKD